MIPVNKLFYEFGLDPEDMPKGFKPQTWFNRDAEVNQFKSGMKRANMMHDARLRTDSEYRNKQLAKGAGYAVSNMANRTANWVGQNQGLVKGAGLVGAGMLAHRMMNRRKPGM